MPSGCCGGGTCSCQIITEGRLTVEGSGQPSDPFILSAQAEFAPDDTGVFLTDVDGIGTEASPWQVQVGFSTTAKLDDLPDVDTPSPTNGQVLAWNSATGRWVAAAPTTAPVGAVSHDTSLTGDGSAGSPLAVTPNGARYVGVTASGVGLNDQGMTSVVHHFTNAASRSAAIPAPTYNMLSMLDTGPGVLEYWTGTAWSVLPNQTGWVASQELLELSGSYSPGLPITVIVKQVDATTDANGVFDVLATLDLTGRSGVLTAHLQETGAVAWKAMVFANTDRISATAYRLTDGSVMAGTPITATVQAVCY